MSPFLWLGITVILVVVVALTGSGPKGGKPVARTHLMGMARLFLLLGIVACGVMGVLAAMRR